MPGSAADSDLSSLYRIRFSDQELDRKNAIWRVLCRQYFSRFINASDTVVDIGCGFGDFINNIEAARRVAIDLNPNVRARLSPDIEFHNCSAMTLNEAGVTMADAVFTSNFLEHLPDKPSLDRFLAQVRSILRPGGKYIVMGPNLRYLPGEYWDFYDHHLPLTHLSLSEALQLAGFDIELCIDKFLPYTTKSRLPTHPLLVSLYLQVPPLWRLMGKQFLVIASRRDLPAN